MTDEYGCLATYGNIYIAALATNPDILNSVYFELSFKCSQKMNVATVIIPKQ